MSSFQESFLQVSVISFRTSSSIAWRITHQHSPSCNGMGRNINCYYCHTLYTLQVGVTSTIVCHALCIGVYTLSKVTCTVHVYTLYLSWGTDVKALKVFGLTEPLQQPWQHIHWNITQRNMLHISVNPCRHWIGKQE